MFYDEKIEEIAGIIILIDKCSVKIRVKNILLKSLKKVDKMKRALDT